jgi:hypothetical protein
MLRDLLAAIGDLTFRKNPIPEITIVIVDNDERGSAEQVCRSVVLPCTIRYAVESMRGITYARNRAIAESGSVDFIAFIDDDEVPSPRWLDELLWTQAKFGADVVSGPVAPRYASDIAPWVKQGGFFEGKIDQTGTVRETCATNNVLIRTHVLRSVPSFDHTFALSGAEDTNFFLRVKQAGFIIVWSQEAVVSELVPPDRANVAWILRRDYQTGNGWVFCEIGLNSAPLIRVLRFCKASMHIAMGCLTAVWGALRLNQVAILCSMRRASLGAGMLSALAGHRFLAYRGSAGTPLPDRPVKISN